MGDFPEYVWAPAHTQSPDGLHVGQAGLFGLGAGVPQPQARRSRCLVQQWSRRLQSTSRTCPRRKLTD
eukprot:12937699-Prorocentrum_lima.AAC.1